MQWVEKYRPAKLNEITTQYNIIESLKYCQQNTGLEIFAFVIMPSHIHMMCSARDGSELSSIMRDFKKFTSKAIIVS
jgi:REP element-mobilizing transposase RayT